MGDVVNREGGNGDSLAGGGSQTGSSRSEYQKEWAKFHKKQREKVRLESRFFKSVKFLFLNQKNPSKIKRLGGDFSFLKKLKATSWPVLR